MTTACQQILPQVSLVCTGDCEEISSEVKEFGIRKRKLWKRCPKVTLFVKFRHEAPIPDIGSVLKSHLFDTSSVTFRRKNRLGVIRNHKQWTLIFIDITATYEIKTLSRCVQAQALVQNFYFLFCNNDHFSIPHYKNSHNNSTQYH